jgi:DNA primase
VRVIEHHKGDPRLPQTYTIEQVDAIRRKVSLLDIANKYTTLKRCGRKWVGLCPFHSEETPSFTVDEEKQLYDIFSVVMDMEKVSFDEAAERIEQGVGQ